jgi:hypothetical protein
MVDSLLHDIAAKLQSQGLRMGRQTYGEYSDAEVSMARAAWCTVLHQRPSVVVIKLVSTTAVADSGECFSKGVG